MPTKKTPRKKAPAKKTTSKKAATPKKAARKVTAKKAAPNKAATEKAAPKKAAPKKSTVIAAGGPPIAFTGDNLSSKTVNVTMKFLMGVGAVRILHASGGAPVVRKPLTTSGSVPFGNVKSGDTLTITGTCTGSAELSTDANTIPASDPNAPIRLTKNISKILGIK